jgi:MFS family permease
MADIRTTTMVTEQRQHRKIMISGAIGTTIEYFDFFLYGLVAPSIFNKLFFPEATAFVSMVSVLGTYAVGYLARPVGGIVFGHFGDRIGRKPMLFLSLILMGLSTCLIGLLPTYAAVGAVAPLLLIVFRFLQGFAIGGETAGANILMTENAPVGKRGAFNGVIQVGAALGAVLASLSATLIHGMDKSAMLSWGWRIPFLCSAVLLLVGLYIRTRIEESPVFKNAVAVTPPSGFPVLTALREEGRACLTIFLIVITETSMLQLFTVFILVFGPSELGVSTGPLLNGVLVGNIIGIVANPVFGRLSDRVGRRPLMGGAIVLGVLYTATVFLPMLRSGNELLIIIAVAIPPAFIQTMLFAVEGSFYAELFRSARLRFSGLGISRQTGGALGGLFPIVATWLFVSTGSSWSFIGLYAVLSAISLVALRMARETSRETIK